MQHAGGGAGRGADAADRATDRVQPVRDSARLHRARAILWPRSRADRLADVEEVEPKENFRRFLRREPLGVVLVLAPWNHPWLASVNAVVPAILAGNSVILEDGAADAAGGGALRRGLPRGGSAGRRVSVSAYRSRPGAEVIGDERIGLRRLHGFGRGRARRKAASRRQSLPRDGLELGGKGPGLCTARRWRRRSRTWWTAPISIPASPAARSSAFTRTGSCSTPSWKASSI